MRPFSLIFAALVLALSVPFNLQASEIRYVSASRINVREQASISTKVIDKWSINQKVNLLSSKNEWCEVSRDNQATSGFVQCSFLANLPTKLSQIELDAANAVLAINRGSLEKINLDSQLFRINELFQQLERHFYYSPSLHTYQLYQNLIVHINNRFLQDPKNLNSEAEKLSKAKLAQLPAMKAALSFNPAQTAYPPITKPIHYTLDKVLKKRQNIQAYHRVAPSYFKNGVWSFGWEGGRFYSTKIEKSGNGFVYQVGFDAYGLSALGATVEMAKHYKTPVATTFRKANAASAELSQMQLNGEGYFEFGEVVTNLPAYAITDKGLIKGTLRKVSFAGDACWGEEANTYAEFVFPSMLNNGTVHGFFVSSAPVDANIAKVSVTKKTTHSYETLTHSISAQIDLDGDGISDLRTVISNDMEVAALNASPFFASHLPTQKPRLMPVGGWYANDIFSLEANQDGEWQTLSIYNVVTCT